VAHRADHTVTRHYQLYRKTDIRTAETKGALILKLYLSNILHIYEHGMVSHSNGPHSVTNYH